MKGHLTHHIKEGEVPILCPDVKCKEMISDLVIASIVVAEKLVEKYYKASI